MKPCNATSMLGKPCESPATHGDFCDTHIRHDGIDDFQLPDKHRDKINKAIKLHTQGSSDFAHGLFKSVYKDHKEFINSGVKGVKIVTLLHAIITAPGKIEDLIEKLAEDV